MEAGEGFTSLAKARFKEQLVETNQGLVRLCGGEYGRGLTSYTVT